MQRYLYIVLFVLVLVLPFIMRLTLMRAQHAAEAGGPVAGRLVIITPHNQDIRREFAWAFNQWHLREHGTRVEIDYRTPGGTGDIRRQLEMTYRQHQLPDGSLPEQVQADIDIVWGGGDFFFDVEIKGFLQPLGLDPALLDAAFPQPALAGVRLYDHLLDEAGERQPPRWVGVCLSSFGIVYNPELFDALELPPPTGWADLTHEKLHGLVALADPTHSGSAALAYMMVLQRAMADAEDSFLKEGQGDKGTGGQSDGATERRSDVGEEVAAHAQLATRDSQLMGDPAYDAAIRRGWEHGMSQLLLIAANARYFTGSATQVPQDVSIGDAAAGMAIDFYGRVYEEIVGERRVRYITPAAATATAPDPVAVLYGVSGKQRVLANRFVEFLLTPEGQRLWILQAGHPGGPRQRALHRPPIRRDVYHDTGGWADQPSPFEEAGRFNQRQEWMALFGDIRPIWTAAWIDSRETLKSSYARILGVPDSQRRAELIAELSRLPITMADVEALRDERRRIQRQQGPIDQWRAEKRIEWSNTFRRHYAHVADKAR